jgi:TM2 domain-containing membrane protein YozV
MHIYIYIYVCKTIVYIVYVYINIHTLIYTLVFQRWKISTDLNFAQSPANLVVHPT